MSCGVVVKIASRSKWVADARILLSFDFALFSFQKKEKIEGGTEFLYSRRKSLDWLGALSFSGTVVV